MTTSAQEGSMDPWATGSPAILSSATLATVQAFVAQTRSTAAPTAAKTLLVVGGEAATAQVVARIAGDLKRDVVRVPLSGVASKYVGETEKNLDRVFSTTAKDDAILLLDEADALFGRRGGVKDSHDRYANAAVDGFLRRIASHGGVAILTTRGKRNLDDAFTRRLAHIAYVDRSD